MFYSVSLKLLPDMFPLNLRITVIIQTEMIDHIAEICGQSSHSSREEGLFGYNQRKFNEICITFCDP